MQFKSLFITLFLGLVNLTFATPNTNVTFANTVTSHTCNLFLLPAPASLNVDAVGSNWAKVSWPQVPGAVSYHLITRIIGSGNIVDDQVISAAVLPVATILGLNSSTEDYQAEIRSVDSNGGESDKPTYSAPIHTIIFELVGNGYQTNLQNFPLDCTIIINGSPCEYSLSPVDFSYFRVSKGTGNPFKTFKLNVSGPTTYVWWNSPSDGDPLHLYSFALAQNNSILQIWYGTKLVASMSSVLTSFNGELYRNSGLNDAAYLVRRHQLPVLKKDDGDERFVEGAFEQISYALSATPNPFSNLLEVTLPFTDNTQDVLISLYDLQGRQVLNQPFPGGEQMITLSTNDIIPGMYFLHARSGDKFESIRVLKTQ